MSEIEPPFVLTEGERRHPLWIRLQAHLTERLRIARCRNDGDLSPEMTAILRGQIKCLVGLIALGNEPPHDG